MARSKKKTTNWLSRIKAVGVARLLICVIAGLVGTWLALALAISGVTRIKAPAAALSFVASDSVALASRADQMFFASPKAPPPEVTKLAREALANQAINAKALRVLGYVAETKGDSVMAEKYVRMAAKLSRREPGAQLWLIEAAARTGNIPQTLVHYDIALRTKPDTQSILYPRLLSAIDDKDIRTNLKPYIRAGNGWGASFLFFANSNSQNLPALVDLIVETGGLTDPETAKNQELGLLGRLVNEGFFDQARRLYLQLPGARAVRLTSTAFDASDIDDSLGAMGWTVSDDPDVGGAFSRTSGDRQVMLSLFANSATTRTVASKLLYLKPGRYDFRAQLSMVNQGVSGFIKWQLRCPSVPSLGAIWSVQNSARSTSSELSVPVSCPVQYLDLIASGGNGQTGLEATVASVALVAARQ
ncbi:MAG: hypothetical protein RSE16_03610 [Sphingobium sp.]|nr:MAG: hypothetical protein RSE16_03610 [Sphingobium sp.]